MALEISSASPTLGLSGNSCLVALVAALSNTTVHAVGSGWTTGRSSSGSSVTSRRLTKYFFLLEGRRSQRVTLTGHPLEHRLTPLAPPPRAWPTGAGDGSPALSHGSQCILTSGLCISIASAPVHTAAELCLLLGVLIPVGRRCLLSRRVPMVFSWPLTSICVMSRWCVSSHCHHTTFHPELPLLQGAGQSRSTCFSLPTTALPSFYNRFPTVL